MIHRGSRVGAPDTVLLVCLRRERGQKVTGKGPDGAPAERRHVRDIGPDRRRQLTQEVVQVRPGPLGRGAVLGHCPEPADALLGSRQDAGRFLRPVLGPVAELDDQDAQGLRQQMQEAPPRPDAVKRRRVGAVGDEIEAVAGGAHAGDANGVIALLGLLRLARDFVFGGAVAGPGREHQRAEVAQTQNEALADELMILVGLAKVQQRRQLGPPAREFGLAVRYRRLHLGPRSLRGLGCVNRLEDVMLDRGETSSMEEVRGAARHEGDLGQGRGLTALVR